MELCDAASRSSVDDFWSIWSKSAEAGSLHAYTLLEVLLLLVALLFLVEVVYVFVVDDLEVKLLVVGTLVGYIVLLIVMRLIVAVPSFSSIPRFLLFYSFVGGLNLLLMFLRVLGIKDSLRLGGMLW